jgi:hydrogenase maturation protease
MHLQCRKTTRQKVESPLKTVVIGVGNPLLGDDGVGNRVARLVKTMLPPGLNVDVKEVSASGIELVEEIMEYDTAIIVDAIATNGQVGTIRKLTPEQLRETIHFTTPHHFNFASAYEFGKLFASKNMPKNVTIYGIEIELRTDFSENISPNVAKAAELIAVEIIGNLTKAQIECPKT